MKPVTLITILAFLLLITSPRSQARIGETEADIQQRYGAATVEKQESDPRDKGCVYHSNGFIIMVHFLDGKSASEYFKKEDNSPILQGEAAVILKANEIGGKWNNTWGNSTVGYWEWTLGSSLWARLDSNSRYLVITTHEFEAFAKREKAAALSGF
jgi:hypothetical protein